MTANMALCSSGLVVAFAGWAYCYFRWKFFDLIDFFVLGVSLFFGVYSLVNSQLSDVSLYDPYTIIGAHLLVLLMTVAAAASGYLLPVRIRQVITFRSLLEHTRAVRGSNLLILVVAITAFSIVGVVKYGVASMGASSDVALSALPYWFKSLKQLEYSGALAGLLPCIVVRIHDCRRIKRLIWLIATFLVFSLMLVSGRRLGILAALTAGLCYLKISDTNPFSFRRVMLVTPFAAFLILIYSNVYQTYRQSLSTLAISRSFQSSTPLSEALGATDVTMEDVAARDATWTYPYLVLTVVGRQGICGGVLFIQAIKNLVPSAFQPNKEVKNADSQLEELYNLPDQDLATSIFGLTYADFGVLGMVAVPLIVCCMMLGVGSMMIFARRFSMVAVLIFGMGAQPVFMTEGSYEDYLGLFRTMALMAIVVVATDMLRAHARSITASQAPLPSHLPSGIWSCIEGNVHD
jgi:hypothetical protein